MNFSTTTVIGRTTRLLGAGLATLICVLTFTTANAQSKAGRLSFGFDGGASKYYGNFTDSKFGFDGDLFIRWNIIDWLSLHAAYNAGQLRYGINPTALSQYPQYFGTNVTTGVSMYPGTNIVVDPTNVVRVGGWELMLSANVFPSQTFVPYVIAGIEAINFEPKTANNGQSLPNNANQVYSKNVIGGVLGLGYEMFLSDKVTFNGKVMMHLTGTDWLDDFSDPKNSAQDAYLTFGVGFGYVLFSPPEEASTSSERNNTTINNRTIYNETTVIEHRDTVFIKAPADTVYLRNPKVNAVYNFPGTLFLVNSDEFNMTESGNAENLMRIKQLANQCTEMRIEIQGFASNEGTPERNQELSEMRAKRIKTWLVAQGVSPERISGTVGFGTSRPMVNEPAGGSAAQLEEARVQNRRIAVRVVATCNR